MRFSRLFPAPAALLGLAACAAPVSSLESLVRAEREFARQSVELGMPAAFDANFADDGVWFTPHPEKTRDALAKRPRTRPGYTLDWYPTFGDVSAAGDLGYSTGPFMVADRSPERRPSEHGYFFSIWKREPGGPWKVALDIGINLPAGERGEDAGSWRPAGGSRWAARAGTPTEPAQQALARREESLRAACAARGLARAYRDAMAEDFRVYRKGALPFTDSGALARLLRSEEERGRFSWNPTEEHVARSGDLGYTWGAYERGSEKGYYAHVWRREADGAWRLAIEVLRPLPAA